MPFSIFNINKSFHCLVRVFKIQFPCSSTITTSYLTNQHLNAEDGQPRALVHIGVENSNIMAETPSLQFELSIPPQLGAMARRKTSFPWDKLPHELREQIFHLIDQEHMSISPRNVSYFKWTGTMPALIVALRDRKEAYNHVLEVFEKHNSSIVLDPSTSYSLSSITDEEALKIQKAFIQLRYKFPSLPLWLKSETDFELSGISGHTRKPHYYAKHNTSWTASRTTFHRPIQFTQQFLRLRNLREVHLSLSNHIRLQGSRTVPADDFHRFIVEWPFWLQGCTQLSRLEVAITLAPFSRSSSFETYNQLLTHITGRVSKRLGIEAKRIDMDLQHHFHYHPEAQVWRWEAVEGQTMDWDRVGLGVRWDWSSRKKAWWNFFDDECFNDMRLEFRQGVFVLEGLWWYNRVEEFSWASWNYTG